MNPTPTQAFTINGNVVTLQKTRGDRAIPYIEYRESRAKFGTDASEATRIVGVKWDEMYDFVQDVLGTSKEDNTGSTPYGISRKIPEEHPEYPAMYATSVEMLEAVGLPATNMSNLALALASDTDFGTVKSFSSESNMAKFRLAKLAVTYQHLDYAIVADDDLPDNKLGELNRYVTRKVRPSGQSLPVQGGALYWALGAQPAVGPPQQPEPLVDGRAIVLFHEAELHYIWRQIPAIPYGNIQKYFNKIHKGVFDGFWPAKTIQFLGPEFEMHKTASGDIVWDIDFVFCYRPQGHNYFYSPKVRAIPSSVSGFYLATKSGTQNGELFFPEDDLHQLFTLQ